MQQNEIFTTVQHKCKIAQLFFFLNIILILRKNIKIRNRETQDWFYKGQVIVNIYVFY